MHCTLATTAPPCLCQSLIVLTGMSQQVIWLDVDNIPLRDPSFLFDAQQYKDTGALFWQDYWANSMAPQVSSCIGDAGVQGGCCMHGVAASTGAARVFLIFTGRRAACMFALQWVVKWLAASAPWQSACQRGGDALLLLGVCSAICDMLLCAMHPTGRANAGGAQGEVVPRQL